MLNAECSFFFYLLTSYWLFNDFGLFFYFKTHSHASRFPISSGAPDTLVYFVITNIEHDVAHSTNAMTTRDQYLDATVGELGCWVSPEVTRIVQEGVEHARPPTLTSTKGIV